MGKLCTYTGKLIDLENVKAEDICIRDIAHALSLLCRYNGHTKHFYSVAEHCVLLSKAEGMPGTPLARLLHDAAEAYLGDVSSPLKPFLHYYQYLEDRIQKVIAEKYRIDFGPVKPGDTVMLILEAQVLMSPMFFDGSSIMNLPPVPDDIHFMGWCPRVAEQEFINRAVSLGVQY